MSVDGQVGKLVQLVLIWWFREALVRERERIRGCWGRN
jgi:hypothetical protein